MTDLELKFLGELEVLRGGQVLPLPPSRKTRALLAWLALNPKPFRREQLCELLWDIPDDPRGSLRWSLSKLRRLVDEDRHTRIVADRLSVCFDASGVRIDVHALQRLADDGLDIAPLEVLEDAAVRYRGHFLEGLELPNFHDFEAWCVAERERVTRTQARVLNALIGRLADEPERALPHARALAGLLPYDETARAALIRLLTASGRFDEAKQQYQLGARLLKEIGAQPTGALSRALRGGPGENRAAPTDLRLRAAPDAVPGPTTDVPALATELRAAGTDPLVGRDVEVDRLRSRFKALAAESSGRLVVIRGEPGIGKSRLLRAAVHMARESDALLLEACAYESEAIRPFALWIDALRALGSEAATRIFAAGGHDHRDRLFDALGDFVARESQTRPVVAIFDDLQWADDSSAAALHYVARLNSARPFLGIVATRDAELADNTAVRRALGELRRAGLVEDLPLGGLSEAALHELIAARVPGANSEPLRGVSGGNPLLAVELARAEVAGDSGGSLGELIRERLAHLDIDSTEVLRWAAVLAPRIDVGSLTRATGLDAACIGTALDHAERLNILLPADRGLRFSHDLVARSIYAGISPTRRRMMHRRVAELLEQDTALDLERAADLAHHASQSGDAALAARAMVCAGRLSLRFFANEDARTLARRGLQWAEQLSEAERVCVTLELREIMLTATPPDDWESVATECVALAERALDHGALSHARLGYHMASHLRWMHGHWAGAHEQILQSERVTRGASEDEHIVGMAEAAKCLAMLERDLNQADAMLMEAQALASRRRVSHHAIPAALGMLRYHENRLDDAVELFKEARTLARSAGDRISEFQANEYLAMIELERGRLDAAKTYCASLIDIGGRLREGSEAPFARALDALCGYALDGTAAALDAALEELRIVDAKHRLAYTLTRAALIDLDRRRLDAAVARAAEALEYAEALGRPTEIMLAHFALAKAYEAANDAAAEARHAAAILAFSTAPVAAWARARVFPASGSEGALPV